MKFGRVLTAMVTPFTDNGEVDYAELKRLAVHLLDNGNDSLLVCGTTAETPTLTHDEKLNIVKAVKEAVGDRAPILVGTGTNNTLTTIEATKEMEAAGADDHGGRSARNQRPLATAPEGTSGYNHALRLWLHPCTAQGSAQ